MKKSFLFGIGIVCAIVGIVAVFNYQAQQSATPLSQIFPEDVAPNVEYEYVDSTEADTKPAVGELAKPVQPTVPSAVAKQPLVSAPNGAGAPQTAKTTSSTVVASTIAPKMESENILKVPFTIQISSFREKEKAEKILSQLKEKGFSDAYIKVSDLKEKGVWYRIYVGRFDTKPEAESTLTKIKGDYKDSFIISPKN